MSKVKNHSGASKRFKETGSGKIKFKHANKRHRLRNRSKKQKRHLNMGAVLSERDAGHARDLLNLKTGKKSPRKQESE